MKKKKIFSTLDLYLSAFLSQCGIPPELSITNNRVIFQFPISDELYKLITNYNSNVSVPVAEFVTRIKTLRGQMLTMKNGGKR